MWLQIGNPTQAWSFIDWICILIFKLDWVTGIKIPIHKTKYSRCPLTSLAYSIKFYLPFKHEVLLIILCGYRSTTHYIKQKPVGVHWHLWPIPLPSIQAGSLIDYFLWQQIGNPLLDFFTDFNAKVEFLWSHGLISEPTYNLLKTVCNYSRYWDETFLGNVSDTYDVTLDIRLSALGTQKPKKPKVKSGD